MQRETTHLQMAILGRQLLPTLLGTRGPECIFQFIWTLSAGGPRQLIQVPPVACQRASGGHHVELTPESGRDHETAAQICTLFPSWRTTCAGTPDLQHETPRSSSYHSSSSVSAGIREYGSTLYVGMTRVKNGGRIKRVH